MDADRLNNVRELLHSRRLGAMLVLGVENVQMANVRYLSGFSGSDASLLISAKHALFFTDGRYIEQSRAQISGMERVIYADKFAALAEAIKRLKLRSVGFESDVVSVAALRRLADKLPGVRLEPLNDEIDRLREIKSAAEVAALRCAVRVAERALRDVLPLIKPGARERDVAAALDAQMLIRGAQAAAFDTIVASGPRGALPHGIASPRRIRAGELVTIDWGARVDGYNSDQTVTFGVGDLAPWQREIYAVTFRAQRAAIAACKPGVELSAVDAAARRIIEQAGFGERFTHGTGHGVGMLVHEGPRVSSRAKGKLEPGHVVTVEPGIYLPGKGGVRLEDMVLIERTGPRLLTSISKRLRVL